MLALLINEFTNWILNNNVPKTIVNNRHKTFLLVWKIKNQFNHNLVNWLFLTRLI